MFTVQVYIYFLTSLTEKKSGHHKRPLGWFPSAVKSMPGREASSDVTSHNALPSEIKSQEFIHLNNWPGLFSFFWYSLLPNFPELFYFWCFIESESHSVMYDSLWPHGLCSPWNSPGQNTGVGSVSLLQGIFQYQTGVSFIKDKGDLSRITGDSFLKWAMIFHWSYLKKKLFCKTHWP